MGINLKRGSRDVIKAKSVYHSIIQYAIIFCSIIEFLLKFGEIALGDYYNYYNSTF